MAYIPDSNIVLRLVNKKDPNHLNVSQTLKKLESDGETIVIIIPQILVEFWVVATRPIDVNGLGMMTDEAEKELENLQKLFTVLPENERIFDEWKMLVAKHKVSGKLVTRRANRRGNESA